MKHIAIFLFLLIVSSASFSQLLFKAKAGLNISRMERAKYGFNSEFKQSDKLGLNVGGAVEYQLNKRVSLQAELMYSLKGLKTSYQPIYTTTSYKYGYDFHYVELPLLLRLSFNNGFRLGVGPSIACMVVGKETTDEAYAFHRKPSFSRLDYGLNGDLSFAFRQFEISARYNYGLRMVNLEWGRDAEISVSAEEREIGKNRTLQIGLVYLFRQ